MTTNEEIYRRLLRRNAEIDDRDPGAAEAVMRNEVAGGRTLEQRIADESIIMLQKRPVLAIKGGTTELRWRDDNDRALWEKPLADAKAKLDQAIGSVGRIDLTNAAMAWVGTGWVIADDVLVTNRHVARIFTRAVGGKLDWVSTVDGRVSASCDFLHEIDCEDCAAIELVEPMHVADESGPDLAFFRIAPGQTKIPLGDPSAKTSVATIGYPASDPRIPQPDEMKRIFANTYERKRCAPGQIRTLDATQLQHDCTTLGGNSGSAVIDLATGKAVGLHFSGSYLEANYAVRADVVAQALEDVRNGRDRRRPVSVSPRVTPVAPRVEAMAGTTMSVTVPITITVSVGSPQPVAAVGAAVAADDGVSGDEAKVEDYSDREGYAKSFLVDAKGKAVTVDMPEVVAHTDDILKLAGGGSELKYLHFSVVMSKSRRMCFFSAANIDGNLSKKSARVSWKWDPRVPRTQQIMNECYGNPPKFARGHMTRREDPGWGTTMRLAKQGNEDSMHVTNTCPQMQAFNSPIWLALEDYALQHAREDKMKICVFTGPYFADDDPTYYGVKVPIAFWKIIAFIHDDSGKLSATGYEMDQLQSLPKREEFVFGQFTSPQLAITTQVPIRSIELRSGIQFARLIDVDPLSNGNEAVGGGSVRLESLDQIRFV